MNCYVSISTKRTIERLAAYFRVSIAEALERLVRERASMLLERLTDDERERFFEERGSGDDSTGGSPTFPSES